MATPAQVGLTIAEANQAQAAINRLDGPLGHGRTIFVEFEKGNRLIRRTVGSDAHGVTSDGWRSIDLTTVV
jgi:hypothetical protein